MKQITTRLDGLAGSTAKFQDKPESKVPIVFDWVNGQFQNVPKEYELLPLEWLLATVGSYYLGTAILAVPYAFDLILINLLLDV